MISRPRFTLIKSWTTQIHIIQLNYAWYRKTWNPETTLDGSLWGFWEICLFLFFFAFVGQMRQLSSSMFGHVCQALLRQENLFPFWRCTFLSRSFFSVRTPEVWGLFSLSLLCVVFFLDLISSKMPWDHSRCWIGGAFLAKCWLMSLHVFKHCRYEEPMGVYKFEFNFFSTVHIVQTFSAKRTHPPAGDVFLFTPWKKLVDFVRIILQLPNPSNWGHQEL